MPETLTKPLQPGAGQPLAVAGAATRSLAWRGSWLVRLCALAWRNLWRNRRRTWLTVSGIAFAVWFLIFARSMQTGTFDLMIDNGARLLPGHMQVQHPSYQDDPDISHTIRTAPLLAQLQQVADLQHVSARAQGFALVSVGERSFGAQVMGVQPEVEAKWGSIAALVRQGRYLADAGEAVMGTVLARNLGLNVDDEFVVLGTARGGGVAAMAARLVGIFETGNLELNRSVLQVHVDDFRAAWSMADDEAHSLVAVARSVTASEQAAVDAAALLPDQAVLNWQELMPEAQQTRDMKAVSTELLFYVIAVIVGFSVVTTFMMMVFERTQEIGVLVAIGMKPGFIQLQLQIEALLVALMGISIGVALAAVLNAALSDSGIPVPADMDELYERFNVPSRIYPAFDWNALRTGSLLMLVGVQLAAFIPGLRIRRLRPVEALRHQN